MTQISESNSYNGTTMIDDWYNGEDEKSVIFKFGMAIAYSIIFVVGVSGNASVVCLLYKEPRMRSITNILFLNLACADLLVIIFCLPFQFFNTVGPPVWKFGKDVCKIVPYLQGTSVSASTQTLMAISIEKFFSVCFPMRCIINVDACKRIIAIIWIFSLVVMFPWYLYFDLVPIEDGTDNQICMEKWPSEYTGNTYFIVVNMLLCFLAPLSVVVFCNLLVMNALHQRKLPGESIVACHVMMLQRSKIKVIQMTIRVIVVFVVCWTPLYIIFFIIKFGTYDDRGWPVACVPYAQIIAVGHSSINPILYAYYNKKFRDGFISMLEDRSCCKPTRYTMNSTQMYYKGRKYDARPTNRTTIAIVADTNRRNKAFCAIKRTLSLGTDMIRKDPDVNVSKTVNGVLPY